MQYEIKLRDFPIVWLDMGEEDKTLWDNIVWDKTLWDFLLIILIKFLILFQ